MLDYNNYNKFLYIYFLFTLVFISFNNKQVTSNICFLYKKIVALINKKKASKCIDITTERIDEIQVKPLVLEKYEDKYLEKYKSFKNERIFTIDEILLEEAKFNELVDACLSQKRIELEKLEEEKKDTIQQLLEDDDESLEEKGENDNSFTFLQNSITELKSFHPNMNEIRREAHEFIMNNILDNLQNSYVMEKTPLGNVAMCYNNKKGSFEYFSDNTIPYRYLETVARKYVITFYCKDLFVDMELQLKNAEIKREEDKENNKQKENIVKTKDLFNNFKNNNNNSNKNNYNNNNNNSNLNKTNNDKFILKENANRFTHNGKFFNFIMLKKVDKKQVDKNYALSYKEFMKQKMET
jgi:hypothetical protein